MSSLGSFAARRDSPEQLDLAGLELSAPARGGDDSGERRSAKARIKDEGSGESKREAKPEAQARRQRRAHRAYGLGEPAGPRKLRTRLDDR